jgi:molybdopterin converting factor small subunit
MRVTVKLFARLRDIAGVPELTRDLAPGATIGSVWRQLAGEFPELAPYERSISSALNAMVTRSPFCHLYQGVENAKFAKFAKNLSTFSLRPLRTLR